MSEIDALVARGAELKGELLAYGRGKRFDRAFDRAFDDTFGRRRVVDDEEALINFVDRFLLQHRLPDGRTVVERFVRARGDLPTAERDMLLGWRDVVEGIFEVARVDGAVLVGANLIDELTYRIRTNAGPQVFERTPPGSFIVARLVPLADEWLISGSLAVFPAADAEQLYRAAASTACEYPAAVFRNPEKLTRGWELQHEDRAAFIAFFGSDLIVLPGPELTGRMGDYWRHRSRSLGADGTTTPTPRLHADELSAASTVGVIYDEVDGLCFYADFGLVQDAFGDPALVSRSPYRDIVSGYLADNTVSPLPFHRLAGRDPDRASEVFARLLNKPSFSWPRDGEAFLRSRKPDRYTQPPLPSITPLSPILASHLSRRDGTSGPPQPA